MSAEPSRLDRTLVALTLFILVALPLPVGSNRSWAIGLFTLLIGATTVLWAMGQWRGVFKESRALKPALPMVAMLLLTQLWVAVQWLGGLTMDSGATAQALIIGVGYTLLFLLVINLFHTRKRLTLLLGTLVVSGTLQAFYASFITLSGFEGLLGKASSVTTGTFINRNNFAGYLALTLSAGIGLLLALRETRSFSWAQMIELLMGPKARLRLALVILVIALVMTHSRGGNVAFFSAMLAMSLIFIVRNKENRRRNIFILLSLIVIDTLVVSQYFGLERLKDRLVNTRFVDSVEVVEVDHMPVEIVQKANQIRGQVILDAIPLAMENPIVGQGAGAFEATYPQYADETVRLHFDHAHNDFLQFFIEYGAIGSALLAVFVGWSFYYAMAALWQTRSLFRNGLGLGISMGIASLMIHSFSDFNLQIPANAITFIILCAVGVLTQHHTNRKPRLRY